MRLPAARRFWQGWYERAMSSGISPLCQFAQRLKPYLPGILAHTSWPLSTNLVEGVNNRITAQRNRHDRWHSPV